MTLPPNHSLQCRGIIVTSIVIDRMYGACADFDVMPRRAFVCFLACPRVEVTRLFHARSAVPHAYKYVQPDSLMWLQSGQEAFKGLRVCTHAYLQRGGFQSCLPVTSSDR